MYLASYTVEGASWHQAAAEVLYPADGDRRDAREWWARYRSLLRGLDAVPDSSVSLRVQLGQRLESRLFAVAPAAHEALMRRAIGSFTQLGVVADGEVRFARDRAEHDRLLEFPAVQCRICLPHFTAGDAWFAFDFRVHPHLNGLLAEAHAQEHTLSYHLNIEPMRVEANWYRDAARNALRVSGIAGVPASLDQLQRDLAKRLRDASHLCEEVLGVDNASSAEWLRGALERRFRETYGHLAPDFTFSPDSNQASLTATRHRAFFEVLGVDEICSEAIGPDDRIALLSWQPGSELAALRPKVGRSFDAAEPTGLVDFRGMPQVYTGTDPYAFISYKREDLARIKPLVGQLSDRGYRIWYDKGIPGGAEWDALIEERVQHCEVLLLFLSQAAVRSKYVRREVKFADTLGKPVIGVRLDREIDLTNGMAMLLNQYQVINETAESLAEELDLAVRFIRLG
jgi:TIR domain